MSANSFEQDLQQLDKTLVNGIRAALGMSGLVSVIVGVLILAWPAKTAMVVAGIIAVYALIAGVVNIAVGIFSRKLGTWPRIGYLALGVVFLIAAVLSLTNLGTAAAALGFLLGVVVGVSWIVEGVVGLTMIGDAPSKVWTIVYAVITIIAGIVLLTSPVWGAALLFLLLGVSLVVLGLVQIVRAFRFASTSA